MFLYLISNFFRQYIVYSYFSSRLIIYAFKNVFRLFTFNLNIDVVDFQSDTLLFFPIYLICFYFFLSLFFFVSFGITCFSMITLNLLGFSLAITIAYFILVAALKIMAYILAYLNCHNVHSSDNYTTSHTVYEFCHSGL